MRKLNVKSAYLKGKAERVFEYTPDDIDAVFKENNRNILSQQRGAGLWLWKPYVINKALSLINDGDYLIYSEAASFFRKPIQLLINMLNISGQDIMVFELPLVSKQWTKQETFVRLHCENKGFEQRNQMGASFILLKKTIHSVIFIKEYLTACCDEIAISAEQFDPAIKNDKDFIAHREDQSILSILSMKYKLKPFHDPTQFANRPWEYIASKEVLFNPLHHDNSSYPIIFLHTRKAINNWCRVKDKIKTLLATFPPYVKWEMTRRNKISKGYHI